MLGLPEDFVIEGASLSPPDVMPGICFTISGPGMPETTGSLQVLKIVSSQQFGELLRDRRSAHPAVAENARLDPQPERYTPAKVPVTPPDNPDKWPKFPGQDLDYRGLRGKGQLHTGGPR